MRSFALFLILAAACAAAPDSKKLITRYRAAHDTGDLTAMLALIEFSPETPAEILELSKTTLTASLKLKIIDLKIMPLEPADRTSIEAVRKIYDPTLEPVAKLVVTWDEKSQLTRGKVTAETKFLGVKDGEYRIVTSKKKKPNQAPPTPTSVTPPAAQESRRP